MKLRYSQLVYASTEKSIVTGRAGFGIRTHSSDIDGLEAERINTSMRLNMSVDCRPSLEQLRATPEVLDSVPQIYSFKVFTDNGKHAYAVGRATYLAADYGFFSGDEAFQRIGSNYLAHTLVFDKVPSPLVFRLAMTDNVFLPHNRRVSPDNGELVALVSGEPQALPTGELDVTDLAALQVPVDERLAHIAIALMEARRLKWAHPDNVMGVVIKAWADDTRELVAALSVLPVELTRDLSFVTGYNKGGMPLDCNMVMVDQTCTDIPNDEYNITVNMMDAVDTDGHYPVTNIKFNSLYDHLLTLAAGGDAVVVNKFVTLCMSTEPDAVDLDMTIKMFSLCQTAAPLEPGDIEPSRLSGLLAAMKNLPEDWVKMAWVKLNDVIEAGLQLGNERERINALLACRTVPAGRLNITDGARRAVRDVMFDEIDPQLGNTCREVAPDALISLISTVDKVPYHCFAAVMNTVSDVTVWNEMLRYYFGEQLTSSAGTVIPLLLRSQVKSVGSVINYLFPRNTHAGAVITALLGDPSEEVKRATPAIIADYVNTWYDAEPAEPSAEVLADLNECGVELPKATSTKLALLLAVAQGKEPDVKFGRHVLEIARERGCDNEYKRTLLNKWLTFKPDVDDVAEEINSLVATRQTDMIADALLGVWTVTSTKQRENLMSKLIDNLKWDATVRDRVVATLRKEKNNDNAKDIDGIVDAIEDSKRLTRVLRRKLMGFFFE